MQGRAVGHNFERQTPSDHTDEKFTSYDPWPGDLKCNYISIHTSTSSDQN